jgi:DNA-binding MarR family transcriptional regulator
MDIFDKQKFIFGNLFLIANKLQVIGDNYLSVDDITVKQWFLTVMVSQFGDTPPTLGEVAQLMGSSRQNVKQLALKLQDKEFLSIEKDEQDARALRLKLTEKSKVFWENRAEKDAQFIRELFNDLSENEVNVMFSGVTKLFERIEKMENY